MDTEAAARSAILDVVHEAVGRGEGRPVLVVLTEPAERAAVEALLNDAAVAGVILADETAGQAFGDPARIGYRHGLHGSRWTFPDAVADTVVIQGARDAVGLHIAKDASRRRIKAFVFADPQGGAVARASTRAVIGGLVVRRMHAVSRRVRRAPAAAGALLVALLRSHAPGPLRDLGPLGRGIEAWMFDRRTRRMLRRADRIQAGDRPAGATVMLILGSLAAGGSERQAVNTALEIKRAGRWRPVVVCARLGEPVSQFYRPLLEAAGVEVVDLRRIEASAADHAAHPRLLALCELEGGGLGYDFPADLFRYLILFLRERPRIVHSFLDENNVKAGIAACLARVPRIVLGTRSAAPDNFKLMLTGYMQPGYQILLRRRNVVLYNNSHFGAADYRRWLGRPAPEIAVVHNGVDFATFAVRNEVDRAARASLGIAPAGLVIASVMRLSEEKQPLLWARSVVEISRRRSNVNFVLVGDGPLRGEARLLIANAGVESRVHFIPQTRDVPRILRASDLFLLTSRVEGLPNVLIEAQAVGVPVVTTPAGGAAETLQAGMTGLIAPDHTVRGVADTCLALLEDDTLRADMARTAPKFVRTKFALEEMFRNTLRLYDGHR